MSNLVVMMNKKFQITIFTMTPSSFTPTNQVHNPYSYLPSGPFARASTACYSGPDDSYVWLLKERRKAVVDGWVLTYAVRALFFYFLSSMLIGS